MRVQTIRAGTIREALDEARRRFGEDALLVRQGPAGSGAVEVVVAAPAADGVSRGAEAQLLRRQWGLADVAAMELVAMASTQADPLAALLARVGFSADLACEIARVQPGHAPGDATEMSVQDRLANALTQRGCCVETTGARHRPARHAAPVLIIGPAGAGVTRVASGLRAMSGGTPAVSEHGGVVPRLSGSIAAARDAAGPVLSQGGDVILALGGEAGTDHAADVIEALRPVGLTGLALTRLDLTTRPGGVIEAAMRMQLPLALLSVSAGPVGGLLPARPSSTARLLITANAALARLADARLSDRGEQERAA